MSVLSLIPEDRKKDGKKDSLESLYSSSSRLNLLSKRKRLNPLDMSQTPSARGDKYVTQRVLSAKTHRVKQLQNQLADAHYHLQELSNENRVLRALQKKQEIALQRYENSNAELPSVLNSHNEEVRIQQSKFKQLKSQYREVTQKLKEKDMQYQMLKDEHTHLVELSRDRNLLEREKLQSQVSDLTAKVQQQNETISMLQRRIALEAKNFRHQLQSEINKHKDTRHDLDMAINNADKLTTIIEMKEKMLNTSACRMIKSPVKTTSTSNMASVRLTSKPKTRSALEEVAHRPVHEKGDSVDHLAKLCENSRSVTSALSHDDDTSSSLDARYRYNRSRTNSTSTRSTPNPTRKNSKGSDDMIELAKTVQDGMADLAIFDETIDYKNSSPDEVQKKIETMKHELLNKIKNDEPLSRKASALRRQSTEESIEEELIEEVKTDPERPKSRGRRGSSVSFYETSEDTTMTVALNDYRSSEEIEKTKLIRENSQLQRKLSGKPVEKFCNDIIQDIEQTTNVIDRHMKNFSQTKFESDKLIQQLHAVDKINDFVNINGEIPEETLAELNNNFKILTNEGMEPPTPIARKRSIASRRNSKDTRGLLGDSTLSNQDLLNDLLGRN